MGRWDLRPWVLFGTWAVLACAAASQSRYGSVLSSYRQRELWLRPYDWSYLRVELPAWFSSVTMNFVADVDIAKEQIKDLPKSKLPVICLMDGNPPIPDISDSSIDELLSGFLLSGTLGDAKNFSHVEQCAPFQKNMTVVLTNEKVSPGVYYIGYFNGLGPARTQSKMISRGKAYMVSTNIVIEGCPTSRIWGPYCNQTIDTFSCSQSLRYKSSRGLSELELNRSDSMNNLVRSEGRESIKLLSKWNQATRQLDSNTSVATTTENLITCANTNESFCVSQGEIRFYFLDIIGIASEMEISVTDFRLNQTHLVNGQANFSALLMCYVRYNAMPQKNLYDYSGEISQTPLVINLPMIGRWYIAVQAVNQTEINGSIQETYLEAALCFSMEWQVIECLNQMAGTNCSLKAYTLERIPKKSPTVPFESYYLPTDMKGSMEDSHFSLVQLISESFDQHSVWTYFLLDVPQGAAGALMHFQLKSDRDVNFELYTKFRGLPSHDTWDYYAASNGNSNNSMLLSLNNSMSGSIDFFILYAKEGTWCFSLKHPSNNLDSQTTMSISLEGCPRACNNHGACHYSVDESGLTFYSYCACDRDHGGFDCSNELVTPKGHMWQSIFLVASNAAAILPAFWALRQKAFAEWIIFTSSGISSGLYHACDVGTWCILSFHVLQFLDFWLSFMAVVSTFVYMALIDEASKRAIHAGIFILTALLAVTGATRSANIGIVVAIGALGLLIGWLLEFSTVRRFVYWSYQFDFNISERWQNVRSLFWNLLEALKKRFRWRYLILGFIALAFAATSWKLESYNDYWIWHSLWHITIYSSSFFFLCSAHAYRRNDGQDPDYELTRQGSSSRAELS